MNRRSAATQRGPLLLGCVGALLASIISCCALTGLAMAPALGGSVPPPPAPDPARPDITILANEQFMNRMVTDALPEAIPAEAELDVQPGNRLVVRAKVDLLLTEVDVEMSILLAVQDGRVQFTVERFEAGGQDLVELLGVDADELTQTMGEAMQKQIEAGLGPGAQLMSITTDDENLIITARWVQ